MPKKQEIDEVDAMRRIGDALKGLDAEAQKRALRWANDRFGYVPGGSPSSLGANSADTDPRSATSFLPRDGASEEENPSDLGELYARVAPETEPDRALVVAYWIQQVRGDADFDAQSVNKELKHIGDGVGNITLAFTRLIAQKPQLVIQTKKQGTSRQARKRYKVTTAGIRWVKARLQAGSNT
jgi:hypothetical protein